MRCVWAVLALAACKFAPGARAQDGAIAPPDAPDAAIDTAVFDPASCPARYTDTLPSSTSRYVIDQTAVLAWPALAKCNDDASKTHAIVFNAMQEVLELDALLDARLTIARFYVGGIQSPTATVRDGDWIAFDGQPLLMSAWHTPENEPDDGGPDLVEDHGAQLLIFDRTLTYFHDATGITAYGVVCECDGVPMHPTAQAYVDTDPNNPN